MKKTLILFVFSLFLLQGFSQVAVTDPALLAESIKNWEAQIKNAQEQFTQLKEQTKALQETVDLYKKVNSKIKNSVRVKNIIDQQVQIIAKIGRLKGEVNKDYSPESYVRFIERLGKLGEQSQNNIIKLGDLLVDNAYSLSDYERLKLIDDIEKENNIILSSIRREERQFKKLNDNIRRIRIAQGKE